MNPQPKWNRVSRSVPCPICGRPDWCGVAPDGSVAICMRVESDRPTRNGGWLHSLGEPRPPAEPHERRKPSAPPAPNFPNLWRLWRQATTPADMEAFGAELQVSPHALDRLGAARSPYGPAWAFPMYPAVGPTSGLRLRAPDGRKWAVTGSREGLFLPSRPPGKELVLCEGPTDTAAALTLGLDAIGRPSCTGAVAKTIEYVRRNGVARALIVADADRPGREGAARLAGEMPVPCAVLVPPAKDLRAWLAAGATRAAFDTLARHARWRFP